MKKYLYISIGGAIGAVLRVALRNVSFLDFKTNIPVDTLIINILGCFLLALFMTVSLEVLEVDAEFRMGVSTGLLGAFTTFSTFCKETIEIYSNGQYFSAGAYVMLSFGLGFAGAFLGVVLARKWVARISRNAMGEY